MDKNLEPTWTAYRPDKPEPAVTVTAAARRILGAYKVDERIDNHLRWSRASALGRLTEAKHGANELLLNASREARNAVAGAIPSDLSDLVKNVQQRLHTLGSGNFRDLKPGLDQSLSTSTGNLALYEGAIPLTNFGLGSRRLAGVAAQQLANADKGIILIDEIEYGLEPHRLVNLLTCIRDRTTSSLALVTTHSPTALRHVNVDDLGIVRRDHLGNVTVQSFGPDRTDLQRLLRSSPEAFLARRVVLVEGATEYGFVLQLHDTWNSEAVAAGNPPSAAIGAEIVPGSGGATVGWAKVLADLGYDVVLFMDSDVEKDREAADLLLSRGVAVVRWKDPFHLERATTDVLNASELTALIEKGIELSDDPSSSRNNYLDHLKTCGLPQEAATLVVDDWIKLGLDLDLARQRIAQAAHKYGWFKQVHKGSELAKLVLAAESYPDSDTAARVESLKDAIFASFSPMESGVGETEAVAGRGDQ